MLDVFDEHQFRFVAKGCAFIAGKTCWQGAQTTLHGVLARDSVNGKYFMDCVDHSYFGLLLNGKVTWDRNRNDGKLARTFYDKTKNYLKL